MGLICVAADHRAGGGERYNSGYYFSRCSRCGCDLIRTGRQGWRSVPRGYAVVWKAGRHSHSLAADFDGLLPELRPEANLPATRPRSASWSRAMVGRRGPRAEPLPDPAERSGEYPGLAVLAVILASGLRLLCGPRRRAA
jgi:hypothetical protein